MFNKLASPAILVAAFLSPVGPSAFAGEFRLLPASRMSLAGTATMRNWSCSGPRLNSSIQLGLSPSEVQRIFAQHDIVPEVVLPPAEGAATTNGTLDVEFSLSVADLDCGNELMERDMRSALHADVHSNITFRMGRLLAATHTATNSLRVTFDGIMSVSGTDREETIVADITEVSKGRYRVVGTKQIRMTKFGVKPPVALFGLIRAHDPVWIRFDLIIVPEED